MTTSEQLSGVQGLMVFLGSVASGLEDVLGRGAGAITYRAGRATGHKASVTAREPDNLDQALGAVWKEMCTLGMRWHFAPYLPPDQSELVRRDGKKTEMHLVFDNCMVRCSLFRYGHPQKLSLCLMNHGLFCGLLEQIHECSANLEIVHAGENACLKVLTVEK